ncbi:MAG: hypothetical protein M1826_006411 [Phylliscum demangeonii]|nr:MAG: hypothetical protein M1826_006411 [Phylliscum demangeonii]
MFSEVLLAREGLLSIPQFIEAFVNQAAAAEMGGSLPQAGLVRIATADKDPPKNSSIRRDKNRIGPGKQRHPDDERRTILDQQRRLEDENQIGPVQRRYPGGEIWTNLRRRKDPEDKDRTIRRLRRHQEDGKRIILRGESQSIRGLQRGPKDENRTICRLLRLGENGLWIFLGDESRTILGQRRGVEDESWTIFRLRGHREDQKWRSLLGQRKGPENENRTDTNQNRLGDGSQTILAQRRGLEDENRKRLDLTTGDERPSRNKLQGHRGRDDASVPEHTDTDHGARGSKYRDRSVGAYSHHSVEYDDPSSYDNPAMRAARGPKFPVSIPYTTPSSEFLYGTSVVTAALRSQRRKLYKLYIYQADNRADNSASRDRALEKLANWRGVEVVLVQGDGARMIDKMSMGRPHNGYILEASPLPKLPVTALERVPASSWSPAETPSFHATLGRQSKEEEDINGISSAVPYAGGHMREQRYPLVLMLDGIVDPGNLGNILRTAYFFGIDAVAIANRNCAPLSPIALKASAGASEHIPLLSVDEILKFIDASAQNGWKFYAAVAPTAPAKANARSPAPDHPTKKGRYIPLRELQQPLQQHPCVLMLGGEGAGLRRSLRSKAAFEVSIEGRLTAGHAPPHHRKEGGVPVAVAAVVDSLNVSIAAGILCDAFTRLESTDQVMAPPAREHEGEKIF